MFGKRSGDILFTFDEETGLCSILSGVTENPDHSVMYAEKITEPNPIIALNMFSSRIVESLRAEFLPTFRAHGFDVYTGEKEKSDEV